MKIRFTAEIIDDENITEKHNRYNPVPEVQ